MRLIPDNNQIAPVLTNYPALSYAPQGITLSADVLAEIRPGDVVWIPPGEKHWHGASPTTAMTHTAIQEKLDGKPVDWLEHVTADQYDGRSSRG